MSSVEKVDRDVADSLGAVLNAAPSSVLDADCKSESNFFKMSSVEKVDRDIPDRLGAVLNAALSSVLDADCNVNLTSVNCLVSRRLTEMSQTDEGLSSMSLRLVYWTAI